jgi:hypothetical protein
MVYDGIGFSIGLPWLGVHFERTSDGETSIGIHVGGEVETGAGCYGAAGRSYDLNFGQDGVSTSREWFAEAGVGGGLAGTAVSRMLGASG